MPIELHIGAKGLRDAMTRLFEEMDRAEHDGYRPEDQP
jgi:hypothetical protein